LQRRTGFRELPGIRPGHGTGLERERRARRLEHHVSVDVQEVHLQLVASERGVAGQVTVLERSLVDEVGGVDLHDVVDRAGSEHMRRRNGVVGGANELDHNRVVEHEGAVGGHVRALDRELEFSGARVQVAGAAAVSHRLSRRAAAAREAMAPISNAEGTS